MVQSITWKWLLEGFRFDLETQVKPKTVEYYLGHVRYFARWAENGVQLVEPHLVTKRDIQSFFHYLSHNQDIITLGNGTRRQVHRTDHCSWHYYRSLKRFFAWAVHEGYLDRDPMDGIKLKAPRDPPIEPWRQEHIAQLFKVLEHDWNVAKTGRQRMLAARDHAILTFFLESFIRLEELTGLIMEDMYLEKQRALVRKGKLGKGRWVGFGPITKKALWRYLGLRPSQVEGDALWVTEEGRPLTKHGIQEVLRRLKRDAGLQNVKGSIHKLRHTGATLFLRRTRDMKGLRLLMGHSTLAMTERYTQFIEAEDALEAYHGQGPLDWLMGR